MICRRSSKATCNGKVYVANLPILINVFVQSFHKRWEQIVGAHEMKEAWPRDELAPLKTKLARQSKSKGVAKGKAAPQIGQFAETYDAERLSDHYPAEQLAGWLQPLRGVNGKISWVKIPKENVGQINARSGRGYLDEQGCSDGYEAPAEVIPYDRQKPKAAAPRSKLDSRHALITPTAFKWRDPATLQRRQFVYGTHYIRKFVSTTLAPGGAGKTSLGIVEALAICTGRPLLGRAVQCVDMEWRRSTRRT